MMTHSPAPGSSLRASSERDRARQSPEDARDERNGSDPGGFAEPDAPKLSINEACRMLGVDQSTLRRWSDAGKVPVFRTPGGHRRYSEDDLRALLGGQPRRQERPRVTRQDITDRSLSSYEDDYLHGAREKPWFKAYSTSTLEEHRRLGRRLVDLAVRYAVAQPTASDRPSLLLEAEQIGGHYGRSGAAAGLTVGDTVDAFLYFRHPVVRTVMGMIDEEGLAARRTAKLFMEIGRFMDLVLVATVRAHEAA